MMIKNYSLFKSISILFLVLVSMLFFGQTTQTFTADGTYTVPAGVTSLTVQVWGGGGAGGGSTTNGQRGAGGGAGGYSFGTVAITPGSKIIYKVGKGGSGGNGDGTAGGLSSFLSLTANGGTGGEANNGLIGHGGSASGPDANTTGGNGTAGDASANAGKGGNSPEGGDGGSGSTNNNGTNGSAPGGGGGGGEADIFLLWTVSKTGGNGGNGQIIISATPKYLAHIKSADTGSSTWCAGETRNVTVTIKNIGTQAWTDVSGGNDFNIGIKWNSNGTSWADYNVRTDANNLQPGQTTTYNFTITASNNPNGTYTTPLGVGTNNLTFDVVYEAVAWFGNNPAGTTGVGPGNNVFKTPNQTIGASPIVGNSLSYTNGTSGRVNATAQENGNAVLTAPAGTYFATVNFASYGLPGVRLLILQLEPVTLLRASLLWKIIFWEIIQQRFQQPMLFL